MPTQRGPITEIDWQREKDGTEWGYVFRRHIDRRPYTAVCTVRCIDDGFWKSFKGYVREYLSYVGIDNIDPLTFAGGALVFSSPQMEADRDFVLRNVGISRAHHGMKRIKLFTHHDCAFAGGFERFGRDEEGEFEYHRRELMKAHQVIHTAYPDLDINLHFIDCRGVRRIRFNPTLV